MDELNPQPAAKRARGRPKKQNLLKNLLNDPILLDVAQYEYNESEHVSATLDFDQPAYSTAAEPNAKAELDNLVTAAAFEDGFFGYQNTGTPEHLPARRSFSEGGNTDVTLDIPEDSTRARQVRRVKAIGMVTRGQVEEIIFHPSVRLGKGSESIHVVDLRERQVAAAPVISPVAQIPADDFFLDTIAPSQAAARRIFLSRITPDLINSLEHIGRGAWLYWLLVGQVATMVPNYMHDVAQKLRRRPIRPSTSMAATMWHRAVKPSLSLAVVSVLVVGIPLLAVRWVKNVVADSQTLVASGESGLQQLQDGLASAASLNFASATAQLQAARQTFSSLGQELAQKPAWLFEVAKILPGSAGAAGHSRDLANAGQELAAGGELLSNSLTSLQLQDQTSLTDQLQQLKQQLSQARQHLQVANQLLSTIPLEVLPDSHRDQFKSVKELLPLAIQSMDTFGQVTDFAHVFLGGDRAKTYLVLSQNPNELRGTGGFLGGMAIVTLDHGVVQKLDMPGGGPYDLEAAQKVRVAGPKPLRLLRDGGWYIWDANWWPDGPASLDKIEWFWKNSDGRPIDGVITVSAPAFADLLAVTGPIVMSDYDKTITSENFIVETQRAVELEYDKTENKPKQFLADLTPKLLEALFNLRGPQLLSALGSVNESLANGYILIRSHDPELQEQAHSWGWDGAVRQTSGDYFMLVDTNIGGGKTDGSIVVDVTHRAEVQPDGQIVETAHITRNLKESLPGALRDTDVAAVEDKALRDEISGTRITREFGKTVFANWVVLPVGESRSVEIRYRLPQRLWASASRPDWLSKLLGSNNSPYATYQLLVQAQPGTTDRRFSHELLLPSNTSIAWSQGSAGLHLQQQTGSLKADGVIIGTQTYGAIMYRDQNAEIRS
ncbi:MAG: Tetratricopeptide TPR_2 repeat protein [Candidatus Giovannonibacteria bacterium GW2011_GWA2_53_7]|uniref:Tetratricopeptide TPR_2 repeat protein n=1 Tax=Candidatus Giovannonibacteria bacterium GW2011_GWA2_53_7 TaxID=1618650 RepID=A0A0G1XVE0_9BACT|nr:MAG: Tetratricopeptide TPR_2 repeat protein [Candidatus Giovannonibacteria bacterium GW2011_GWA2_53_7]